MSYVVAGTVMLLALAAGVIAFITSHLFILQLNNEDENKETSFSVPAANLSSLFKKANIRISILMFAAALFSAFAGYLLCSNGLSPIAIIKYVSVAIVLVAAMVIDHRTHLIPNLLVLIKILLGVIILVVEYFASRKLFVGKLTASVVGLLVCLVLFYVMSRLTKDGMGMGDIKLIAAMGWVLGMFQTLISVLLSLIICSVFSLFLIFVNKKDKKYRIAFAPFLFFGYIFMIIIANI